MIVSEFIEFLKGLDQEAIVQVIQVNPGGYYTQSGEPITTEFDSTLHVDYFDFRGNQFVKSDSEWKDKRYVTFGLM